MTDRLNPIDAARRVVVGAVEYIRHAETSERDGRFHITVTTNAGYVWQITSSAWGVFDTLTVDALIERINTTKGMKP